ncbi:MAG: hypothetical protein IPJ97_18495 [Proteobacteria bacterium]|nr:hypothetical protein [Pseudomonadota bacterium]
MTDTLVGTLPYMAPEQLVVGSAIDRRVDVFALGLLMLECALRERAFDGRTPETRLASIRQGVPWRLLAIASRSAGDRGQVAGHETRRSLSDMRRVRCRPASLARATPGPRAEDRAPRRRGALVCGIHGSVRGWR